MRSWLYSMVGLSMLAVACSDSPPGGDAGGTGLSPSATTNGSSSDGGDAATGADGNATTTSSGSGGGALNSGGSDDGDACAQIDARPTPKASAVWFIFDPLILSGRLPTENDGLEGLTNREMFQALLFEPGGVVPRLEGAIQFGMAHYYGIDMWSECPQGFTIAAAYDNAEALAEAFSDAPQFSGTSWHSMAEISAAIDAQSEPTNNTVLLMHREHADNVCELFADGSALRRTAIERLAAQGATVSTIAMLYHGNQATNAEQRNMEMLRLGQALATLGGGQAFATDDRESISQAIEDAVADSVSCEIALEGEVKSGQECQGEVLLGGEPVACNDPDGFRLLDDSTLELTGAACEQLRSDATATLSARFPCNVFVPLI